MLQIKVTSGLDRYQTKLNKLNGMVNFREHYIPVSAESIVYGPISLHLTILQIWPWVLLTVLLHLVLALVLCPSG